MKYSLKFAFLFLLSALVSGCNNNGKITINSQDEKARTTIEKNLISTGVKLSPKLAFDADAVATVYQNQCPTMISQSHHFELDSSDFALTINSRGQNLITEYLTDNKLSLNGNLCPESSEICTAARLKVYAIALSSFMPLLDNKLELNYLAKEQKGGTSCHIVEAKGNILNCCHRSLAKKQVSPDSVKVWIDEQTGYINRIWMKYLLDGNSGDFGYISATIGDYVRHSNGVAIPGSIEFVPSDIHAGESGKTLIKIDLQRVRFANSPTKNIFSMSPNL